MHGTRRFSRYSFVTPRTSFHKQIQARSSMSSRLSCPAIHRILHFIDNDYRMLHGLDSSWHDMKGLVQLAHGVSRSWGFIYELYFTLWAQTPPTGYLRSPELAFYVENGHFIRDVFEVGKPLTFERHVPRLIISKIIEVRVRMLCKSGRFR